MKMFIRSITALCALALIAALPAAVFSAPAPDFPEGIETAAYREDVSGIYGDDGPVVGPIRDFFCVPFFVRMNTKPYLDKLEYIVTVFKIMATGRGDAGWGRARLPYYIPDDETHTLRYWDFSSGSKSIYITDLVIDYQRYNCDFEGMVEDVIGFVEDYNDWDNFFCRADDAEEAWEDYQDYLCDEEGICEGDEDFPSYGDFQDALAGAVDNALEDVFEDFYDEIYEESSSTGLLRVRQLIEYGDYSDAEDALDDTYETALDYYEALESAFEGTAPGYFEITESDINDAW